MSGLRRSFRARMNRTKMFLLRILLDLLQLSYRYGLWPLSASMSGHECDYPHSLLVEMKFV